jgi:deoxyribodipyrimidine photo-lyase
MTPPVIVWFRNDLRLADHPALSAAVESGAPVIAVYLLDPEIPRGPGAASLWWLHYSLEKLGKAVAEKGSKLLLRKGPTVECLRKLVRECGAQAVCWNRDHEPAERRREAEVAAMLAEEGVQALRHATDLLFEPGSVRTKTGGQYSVFTPFYRACFAGEPPADPLKAPERIPGPSNYPASDVLGDWKLLPTKPDWAGGMRDAWTPGEEGAVERLEDFLDGPVRDYKQGRDIPGRAYTSKLSPHLHFGELSSRQVWSVTRHRMALSNGGPVESNGEAFLRELGWREFSCHLLSRTPDLATKPLKPEFADFPWARDYDDRLAAWQQGRTGYPIVDAGMRELWTTGWMHNRVRMITASFLIKHLLIPWQEGEKWFWDTLVDADAANNAASWQWVAGCGADAAPFFRIFNPITQGEKFDPDGGYVRRWVPEVAGLPDKVLHQPWEASRDLLSGSSLKLGRDYPEPLVDHKPARERALEAFKSLKKD